MATPWAALRSYGLTAQAFLACLPGDAPRNAPTVQHYTWAVAPRGADERGEAQRACGDGCPAIEDPLPIPDGPRTVGLDGGDGRDWDEQKRPCAVLVGQRSLAGRRDEEEALP